MDEVPRMRRVLRSGGGACAVLLACCCAVLASCGGSDGSAPPQSLSQVQPPGPVQAGAPASLRAMAGLTTVTLNPQSSPPESSASVAVVAVARDAHGDLQLVQRDGVTRTLSPDGKVTVQPAGATEAGESLPQSMIVAVDSANTVHVVDPDACVSRRIAADGRVSTTFLPAQSAGRPCQAQPRR